jgi:nicotinamide-nucleotide amidase
MATGALQWLGGDVAVSVSGVAGPDGGSPDKPVGTVWFAWAERGDTGITVRTARHRFPGDRDQVRGASVMAALEGLLQT